MYYEFLSDFLFLNMFMMNKQVADFADFSQYSTGLIYVEKTLKCKQILKLSGPFENGQLYCKKETFTR